MGEIRFTFETASTTHSPIPMTPPLVANLVMLPFACLTMSPSLKMGHSLQKKGEKESIMSSIREVSDFFEL